MPKVTLLEQQKNNKERVNVYLDGEFAFGLNIMDAMTLKKGQELDAIQIAELRNKDAIVKATDAAANLLSYRPRSIQEIRRRLAKKGYEEVVIESAIERMVKYGYLDDRAFAKFWIESRNRGKPRGKRALQYELRQKGISNAIIRELLDEMVDEESGAYKAAQKRVRRMRGKTEFEFRKKVGAFLQRRGFGFEAVRQALDDIIEEVTLDDPEFFAEPDNNWR
ncbi:MAG: RecX family transcriptional regulator [Chloroflexota bacterium]